VGLAMFPLANRERTPVPLGDLHIGDSGVLTFPDLRFKKGRLACL
jgi:hypothetical protein